MLSVDFEAQAAYLQLSSGQVAQTTEVGPVNVDVDDLGVVVGVEILNLNAVIPMDTLRDQFAFPQGSDGDLERLRSLRMMQLEPSRGGTVSGAQTDRLQIA